MIPRFTARDAYRQADRRSESVLTFADEFRAIVQGGDKTSHWSAGIVLSVAA